MNIKKSESDPVDWQYNFWIQPANGFIEDYKPVTDDDICATEKLLGFVFPLSYRKLMLKQNGGYIRRRSYNNGKEPIQLFINGAKFESLNNIDNFQSYLESYLDQGEIDSATSGYPHCCPGRLIIFSGLYGHGFVAFDYGWLQEYPVSKSGLEPNIVVFEQIDELDLGYKEVLRVKNIETFLANLVYYGYESESYYIGVDSILDQDNLIKIIKNTWGGKFNKYKDDRFGWFNFSYYYIGTIDNIVENLQLFIVVSPNKHQAGTYLFQDNPDLKYIIEIEPRKDTYTTSHENINNDIKKMIKSLGDATGDKIESLLWPYNFES